MVEASDQWTEEDVRTVVTNPIYVGMGRFPAIMEVELFARVGVRFVKEHGLTGYLRCVYANLCDAEEHLGGTLGFGLEEEFVARQAIKVRSAVTTKHGIEKMVADLQTRLSPS